jgi:hypothetical protein
MTGGRAQGPRLSHARSDPHRHTGTVDRFPQRVLVSREATAAGWVLGVCIWTDGRAGQRSFRVPTPTRSVNAGLGGEFRGAG